MNAVEEIKLRSSLIGKSQEELIQIIIEQTIAIEELEDEDG